MYINYNSNLVIIDKELEDTLTKKKKIKVNESYF